VGLIGALLGLLFSSTVGEIEAVRSGLTAITVLQRFSGDPFRVPSSRGCRRSGFVRMRRSNGTPTARILKHSSAFGFKPDRRPNGLDDAYLEQASTFSLDA